jgi:hypothetical protein
MSICAAFMFFSALLALTQRFLLEWENKRLDQRHGPVETRKNMATPEGIVVENYGPNFRYVL